MLQKRLRREFKNRPHEFNDELNHVTFDYQGDCIVAHLSPDYPFKPPTTLFINGVEMSHAYFYDRPKAVKKELGFTDCCHMCQSFLCSDNWSPCITLHDVAEQMVEYRRTVLQAHYNVYIRKSGMLPLLDVHVNRVLDFI